ERIVAFLERAAEAPLPAGLARRVAQTIARHGVLRLVRSNGALRLRSGDAGLLATVAARLGLEAAPGGPVVADGERGWIKHRLAKLGYPVRDEAGYETGEALALAWRPDAALRPYQREAIAAFAGAHAGSGGSGLVLLPCGAGK